MTTKSDAAREPNSIYDDLHAGIVDGRLAPGSPLIEGGLASEYGVSRSPVREALSRLTYEGLVERYERGLRVRVLKPEDVLDLYEVRIALEAAAARAAAARRTDLDLGRLKSALEAMRRLDVSNTEERPKLAHALHFVVWAASHNQALIDTLQSVQRLVEALASTTLHYPERWETFLAECTELVDAIAVRDIARAGDVATSQMTNARDFRVRLYSAGVDGAPDAFL